MSIDPVSAVMPESLATQIGAAGSVAQVPSTAATTTVSVYDVSQFRNQMEAPSAASKEASAASSATSVTESEAARGFISALHKLDSSGGALGARADNILASGENITPSDMIQLTVESHKFMFQCEITANVANRSAEGIQQLFRQQS